MSNVNDFEIQNGVLVHYNGSEEEVVIPPGVTSIGEEAFSGNKNLKRVFISDGVTRVGKQAFENCHNLTSITISDSVTEVGYNAFYDYAFVSGVNTKNVYFGGDLLKYLDIHFESRAWDKANLYINGELVTDVIIPDGVTSIGSHAFWGCKSLTSITIPDSVTSIGDAAFALNSKLDAVYINDIKSWCNIAFKYDSSNPLSEAKRLIVNGVETTNITIPEGVTNIGRYAFYGYKQLTSVIIPDSVTSIGMGAFDYCTNLSSVIIPNSVSRIEDSAFSLCESLTEINLPESINYIGESAFFACSSLSSIKIPGGVTSISDSAFRSCKNLSQVTISDGVKRIGNQSFGECSSLKNVVLPDSMNWFNEINYKWGNYIFHENTVVILNHYIKDIEKKNVSKRLVFCKTPIQEIKSTNAKDLAVKGFLTVEDLTVYDDAVIESYKKYLKSKAINYVYFVLENEVELIVRRLASMGLLDSKLADKLMENDLSDEIKTLLLESVKEGEKKGDDKKTSANKAPSVTELKKTWSFKKNEEGITITSYKGVDIKVVIPEKIGKDSVTEIGAEAFSVWKKGLNEVQKRTRDSITEISIPNSVTGICMDAFAGCSNLANITIPNSVIQVGQNAFRDNAYGDSARPKNIYIADIKQYLNIHFYARAWNKANLYFNEEMARDITIPDDVTKIGEYAFCCCTSLKNISIPNSVKEIGRSAFWGCESMNNISIPNSVEVIGNNAFEGCKNLKSVVLPEGLEKIGRSLFSGCNNLKNITIPHSVKKIEWNAFEKCDSLTEITIPDSVEAIDMSAFSGCKSLTKVIIPESVKDIGNYAFYNCNNLTIYAPAGSFAKEYAKANRILFKPIG